MNRRTVVSLALLFTLLALAACASSPDGADAAADVTAPDATVPDGSGADVAPDAVIVPDDVTSPDGAAPDGVAGEIAAPDVSVADTVVTDTVATDTIPTDTIPTDTIATDTIATDTIATDSGPDVAAADTVAADGWVDAASPDAASPDAASDGGGTDGAGPDAAADAVAADVSATDTGADAAGPDAGCALDCGANGACVSDPDGRAACLCDAGFEGDRCETNTDDCAGVVCENGGACIDGLAAYTCICPDGYEGDHCETDTDDCAGVVCENGGVCSDGVAAYTCVCPDGYEGDRCETNTDDCAGVVCENGGVCSDGVAGYTCVCPDGYEGVHCETDTDDCAAAPCRNGGSCVDGVAGYTCDCPDGFTGDRCETNTDDCAGVVCHNGGACVDGVAAYTCDCPDGYEGDHCETNTDDCAGEPCQNGGTCVDGVASYTCECPDGVVGDDCETCLVDGWPDVDEDGLPDQCDPCLFWAPETCDGRDNDCSGAVDDGLDHACLVVTTEADTEDADRADGACLDAAGACSLRAALAHAATLTGAVVVHVPAGSYTRSLASDWTASGAVELRGEGNGDEGAAATILAAGDGTTSLVAGADAALTLSSLALVGDPAGTAVTCAECAALTLDGVAVSEAATAVDVATTDRAVALTVHDSAVSGVLDNDTDLVRVSATGGSLTATFTEFAVDARSWDGGSPLTVDVTAGATGATAAILLDRCTLVSGGRGVRLAADGDGTIELRDTTSHGSNTGYGATRITAGAGVAVTIDGCTFADHFSFFGGAIRLAAAGTAAIRHTTFVDNVSAARGALLVETGTVTIESSVVAATGGRTDVYVESGGQLVSLGGNVIGEPPLGEEAGGFVAAASDVVGTVEVPLDPLLGERVEDGRNPPYYVPQPDSPTVDAGTGSGLLDTDVRGYQRSFDGDGDGDARPDAGAVERCEGADVDGDGVPDACDADQNVPPVVANVRLTPTSFTGLGETVTCLWDFSDGDGVDEDHSTVAWTLDGRPQGETAGGGGAAVFPGTYADGDRIGCTVTAHDGVEAGNSQSAEVTVAIDHCAAAPCENGGACFDLIGGFACACPLGYDGETCADCVGDPSLPDVDDDGVSDLCDPCVATGEDVCDGVDNDCDGVTDGGLVPICLVVTTTDDSDDAAAGDGVCADDAGACSVRGALAEAAALGAAQVYVPAGAYPPSQGAPFVADGAVTIRGAGAAATALTGAGEGGTLAVAAGATLRVEDLAISDGAGTGVRCDGCAALTLSGCAITDNATTAVGGGLWVRATDATTLVVEDTTIARNAAGTDAWSDVGAGLYGLADGGALTLVVTDSVIEANEAYAANYLATASGGVLDARFVGVRFLDQVGQGLVVFGETGSVALTLEGSTIQGSRYAGLQIGSIVPGSADFDATIRASAIVQNGCPSGPITGGIYVRDEISSEPWDHGPFSVLVENTTIAANCGNWAGAFWSERADAAITFDHATVTANRGRMVGGIYARYTTPTFRGSVIAANVSTLFEIPPDLSIENGGWTSPGGNVLGSVVRTVGGTVVAGDWHATDQVPNRDALLDPRLGDLVDDGATPPYYEPLADSPAVDAAVATPLDEVPTDQRGQQRIGDGDGDGDAAPDSGAVERCGAIDEDDDGALDGCDPCPGFTGADDADRDGLCTGEDPCPFDPTDTVDADGLCLDEALCAAVAALTIEPSDPSPGDQLVAATPGLPTAALQGGATVSYTWTTDGLAAPVTTSTLPAGTTADGERWTVTVTGGYPWSPPCTATATLAVENHPPTCMAAELAPAEPYTGDDLTCACTWWSDPDGDTEAAAACIFTLADGAVLQDGDCALPASLTARGDTIGCTITVADYADPGAPVTTDTVTLANTPPAEPTALIEAPELEANGLPEAAEASISCRADAASTTDDDGDPLTLQVQWWLNGRALSSAGGTTDTVFTTTLQHLRDLRGGEPAKGDTVGCYLWTHDGEVSSEWGWASVTVPNSPPEITSVVVVPANVDGQLVCEVTAEDDDGDSLQAEYLWEATSETGVVTQIDAFENAIDADVVGRTDLVTCTAFVTDREAEVSATSDPETVINRLPTLAAVSLTTDDDAAYAGSIYSCGASGAADDDGDAVTATWQWLVNGAVIVEETAEEAGDPTARTMPAATLAPGDVVTCRVTPNDGYDEGAAVEASLTVVNHPPVCAAASITPEVAADGETITCACTDLVDHDGDVADYACTWTAWDGTALDWTGCTKAADEVAAGSVFACAVAPVDPAVTGTGASASGRRAASSTADYEVTVGAGSATLMPSTFDAEDGDQKVWCSWGETLFSTGAATGLTYTVTFEYWLDGSYAGTRREVLVENDAIETDGSLTASVRLSALSSDQGVDLKYGGRVRCTVEASSGWDGATASAVSETREASNHQATGTLAETHPLGDVPAFLGEEVGCVLTVEDLDDDATVEGTLDFLTASNAWVTLGTLTTSDDTVRLVWLNDGSHGTGFVSCYFRVLDAHGGTRQYTKDFVPVSSSTPTVDSVVLTPETSTPCEERVCTATLSDEIKTGNQCTATVRWLVDGAEAAVATHTVTLDAATVTATFTADGVSVDDGSTVQCVVQCAKTDQQISNELASNVVAISGAAPTVGSVSVSQIPRLGEDMTCTAEGIETGCATDPAVAYGWWVDGERQWDADTDTFSTRTLIGTEEVVCGAWVTGTTGAGPTTYSEPYAVPPVTWIIHGAAEQDKAGTSIAFVGDLDGDGLGDFLVGAPNAEPDGAQDTGKAYLVFGRDGMEDLELADLEAGSTGGLALVGGSGGWDKNTSVCVDFLPCRLRGPGSRDGASNSARGDGFGWRVSALGDLDGDAISEVLVSAPYAMARGQYLAGHTYVLNGQELLALVGQEMVSVSAVAWRRIDGEQGLVREEYYPPSLDEIDGYLGTKWDGHLAGYGIAGGDFDGDGVPDVAIAAPTAERYASDGRAYVLSGAALTDDVWLGDFVDTETREEGTGFAIYPPLSFSDFFTGQYAHLANVGDHDGDGVDDLMYSFSNFHRYPYVLSGVGRTDDLDLVDEEETDDDGLATITYGEGTWQWSLTADTSLLDQVQAGRVLVLGGRGGGGDHNGDGIADVLVMSPEKEGDVRQVELAVIFGTDAGLGPYDLDRADAGDGGFVIEGVPGDGDVKALAWPDSVGDLDGDGLDDIVFWIRLDGGPAAARFYIVYGKQDTETVTFADLEAGVGGAAFDWDEEPTTLRGGDVDGDGLSDFLVGYPDADDSGLYAGRVEVWFSYDRRGLLTYRGTIGDDAYGGTAADESIAAGRGDDTIDGGGGVDVLYGGAGDDTIRVADATFQRVDGGGGFDRLTVGAGVALDLTAFRSRVAGVEEIALEGGATLTLSEATVLRLSDTTNTLAVLGDETDTVDATAGDWRYEGEALWDGVLTHQYRDGEALLLLEDGLDTRIDPTFGTEAGDALIFEVDEGAATGTWVGDIAATDPDGSVVAVELVAGDPYGAFAFDAATGALTVADGTLLDYEKRATWTLLVSATDDDGLTATGYLTVEIRDAADAPEFSDIIQVTSVQEAAPTGTLVASVQASDRDAGDVLTYTLEGGNDDGAFAIDAATGVITVADGSYLDYETAPNRMLRIRATDTAGLYDEALVKVVLDDVDVVEQVATWTFATSDRSIWSKGGFVGESAQLLDEDELVTVDESWGDEGTFWNVMSGVAMSLTGSLQLTAMMNFDVQASSGDVSASLPIEITTSVPDDVRLGEPFTIETSWYLEDGASMWGETFGLDASIDLDLNDVSIAIGYDLADLEGQKSWGPFDIDPPSVDWNISAQAFESVLYRDVFPEGSPWTTNTSSENRCDENVGETVCDVSLGLDLYTLLDDEFTCHSLDGGNDGGGADDCDYREGDLWTYLSDATPDMLITDNVSTKALDMYITPKKFMQNFFRWSDLMSLALSKQIDDGEVDDGTRDLYLGTIGKLWGSAEIPVEDLGYLYLVWQLVKDWIKLEVTSEEMFMLDVEQVVATWTFENGTTFTGVVGEPLAVTLPGDEDANGDGVVDVDITYEVDARFYHVILVVPTIKWGSVRLHLEYAFYGYDWGWEDGMWQVTGETEQFADSYGPVYDGEWDFTVDIKDFTSTWLLQGFNTPTTRGGIQLTR